MIATSTSLPLADSPFPEQQPDQRNGEYAQLKRLLDARGLFAPQPLFYAFQLLYLMVLLAAGVTVLVLETSAWVKLLDGVFLAVVFTQLGYVGHDAGHRQVFASPRANDAILLALGIFLGLSRSWWVDTHNRHHSDPNDLSTDPHTAIPGMAFDEEQASGRRGLRRSITRFQAYYFFPMLALEGLGIRLASVLFLIGPTARYRAAEVAGVGLHLALYGLLIFTVMNPWQAGLFIIVHQGLIGLYMGSVFAPNHKGMLIPPSGVRLDFLRRQVLTTRNVRSHPVVDFWYGGLNYQIEHHLFPRLSRNKLKQAQPIVKAFCLERSIPYAESGVLQSYAEVTRYLHRVGRSS